MAISRILIVDDELLIREFLCETLRRKRYDVHTADNVKAGFAMLKEQQFDLVITDMKMPDGTGMDILRRVKELAPETLVVIVTAFGSIENAVDAMRLGAFNYLIKPFSPDTMEAVIEKAESHLALLEENQYLRNELSGQRARSNMALVATSPVMLGILQTVQRVAKSNASVFVTGESGTGKEVIAHAIHHYSGRSERPYVRVNCAAIPDTLVESEFFGHEKGAFTGAMLRKMGRFELAHQGTLLLDEITEIPIALQAKLLRAIQEREFERVGGTKLIQVDVRIVATSNRNMQEAIREKIFREDLYYRLNVVPVHLPPLRDRAEDIVPIAEHFVQSFCIENHKKGKSLSDAAKKQLLAYDWPGNIRELANVIERAVVMDYDSVIDAEHLYVGAPQAKAQESSIDVGISLAEAEKRLILRTLESQKHNRQNTADALGISIRTLRNKLNEYKGVVAASDQEDRDAG